ncbi:MAG TPA: FAD-dependent monooxygenase, partial [Blastocatellia bacterium]
LNLWARGERVGHLRFGELGASISFYPYALIFPQDEHEQMLIEQLARRGVHVERSTELVDFADSGDGITAAIRKNSGQTESVRSAFLAGCDGAHSVVRKKLGIEFPGGTYSELFYIADIKGSGPVINKQLHVALDDADFLAVFPMKGEGRARLVGSLNPDVRARKEIGWSDVSQGVFRRLDLQVDEVNWFSTYKVYHRVASQFRKQRAFLLGDAGHIHSPVGGQGMNTGIGDAVNLGWKLAAVIAAGADPSLLDTYEPERIAFARTLVATTDRVFTLVNAQGAFAKAIRLQVAPLVLPILFDSAWVRRAAFRTVSQTAIEYPESPISRGPDGTLVGGRRLPWVQFKAVERKTVDNFSCLATLDWQLHVYGQPTGSLRQICEERGLVLNVFAWTAEMRDLGFKQNAVYIVRPDGYIAITDASGSAGHIADYLDRWQIKPRKPRTADKGERGSSDQRFSRQASTGIR